MFSATSPLLLMSFPARIVGLMFVRNASPSATRVKSARHRTLIFVNEPSPISGRGSIPKSVQVARCESREQADVPRCVVQVAEPSFVGGAEAFFISRSPRSTEITRHSDGGRICAFARGLQRLL